MTATIEEFNARVAEIKERADYPGDPEAFALGLVRYSGDTVLDVRFPTVNYKENYGSAAMFWDIPKTIENYISESSLAKLLRQFDAFIGDEKTHPNIDTVSKMLSIGSRLDEWLTVELVWIDDLSKPITSTQDAWLRLHLLSHRKVTPNSINLDGLFGVMNNVAWTNQGPILASKLESRRVDMWSRGVELTVHSVDKFPPMADYVMPSGVRVADASRVRLGAYLAPGTTVMHEGFVNFNAGTLGASMVEGRISQGVVVGDDSDIGGGASIMGTLSGGGTHKVSIGERCLLGANSGLGISIGDDVIVEAGLYLTGGTKVAIPNNLGIELIEAQDGASDVPVVKARSLSGISGVVFRRNSLTGAVECIPNAKGTPSLNTVLHNND